MIMGKTIAQVQIGEVVPLRQEISSVGIDIEEGGRRKEEGDMHGEEKQCHPPPPK